MARYSGPRQQLTAILVPLVSAVVRFSRIPLRRSSRKRCPRGLNWERLHYKERARVADLLILTKQRRCRAEKAIKR
jgi:hypothetical protein